MNIAQLRSFIENMPDEAPVSFVITGPRGGCLVLKLLEYDENAAGGVSFWIDVKSELGVRLI